MRSGRCPMAASMYIDCPTETPPPPLPPLPFLSSFSSGRSAMVSKYWGRASLTRTLAMVMRRRSPTMRL